MRSVDGKVLGWAEGDEIRADTKLELYWRVSHIRRESVELELSDPAEPSSEDKRLVIPFR